MLYRISEAAKQTGLSCHTLRQWASRYGINASHVSDGGQRLYSDLDIERLKLIDQAKQQGMLLSDLSGLSKETLAALAGQAHGQPFFAWDGAKARLFRAHFPHLHWVDANQLPDSTRGILVWVGDTMTEDIAQTLAQCVCRVEVFTTYISRPHRKLLTGAGCEIHKGEPSEDWFVELVKTQANVDLYSSNDLQQLIQTQPSLECECPNHIADILNRLRTFAHYSLECEIATQEQAWIHRQVFQHIQNAQLSVEKALQLVVHEEGLG